MKDYAQLSVVAQTFRIGSPALMALEQTYLFAESLIEREANADEGGEASNGLLNLDDDEGSAACKAYLCSLERLILSLDLVISERSYRDDFSNSYKALYR